MGYFYQARALPLLDICSGYTITFYLLITFESCFVDLVNTYSHKAYLTVYKSVQSYELCTRPFMSNDLPTNYNRRMVYQNSQQ